MHIKKSINLNQIVLSVLLSILLISPISLTGCTKGENQTKTSDIDFTIVSEGDLPKDLKKLIKKRKKNPFELSYSDGSYLYVIKGYGKQSTSDYSIVVNGFYLSKDNLIFDTDLFGPKDDADVSNSPSYPYIVIKTEYIENPIIFK